MKIRILACRFGLVLAMLLLAILLPETPGVLAAAPSRGDAQIPQPLEEETLLPSPDATALQGETRTLHFPAQSLNYNPSFGVITQYGGGTTAGLQWTTSTSAGSAAFLNVPRPPDWDGTSPVMMHLYFTPISAGSGDISFFIRPRAFDPGETYSDAAGITSDPVPYASRVLKQSFTIPSSRFGSKRLWVIGIQRSDSYAGNVNLLAVGLSYSTRATSSGLQGYPANAINYNASFGAITPYGGGTVAGLEWAAGGGAGSAAFLDLPRPADWDGSSSITVRLYFKPSGGGSGDVNMFIRPRAYDQGDLHGDGASVSGTAIHFTGADVVQRQSFTVSAGTMSAGRLWVIGMQRGGTGETYSGSIVLLAVELSYTRRAVENPLLGLAANGINYNSSYGVITQYGGGTVAGLEWAAGGGGGSAAFVDIPRPADWDGTSDVTLRLYFFPRTSSAGNVDLFIRPRGYNAGDAYGDASGMSGTPVAVSGASRVARQSFSIPASRFGAKELWVIGMQRGGGGETYPDSIVVLAAEISYRAVKRIYLPLVLKRANY